mgnify:CR=1 FL=1
MVRRLVRSDGVREVSRAQVSVWRLPRFGWGKLLERDGFGFPLTAAAKLVADRNAEHVDRAEACRDVRSAVELGSIGDEPVLAEVEMQIFGGQDDVVGEEQFNAAAIDRSHIVRVEFRISCNLVGISEGIFGVAPANAGGAENHCVVEECVPETAANGSDARKSGASAVDALSLIHI